MNTYFKTCKQHILDTIDEYVGYDNEINEMGNKLTESENANGSWYCSTYKAEQDLDKFGRESIAKFLEEYKFEFGEYPKTKSDKFYENPYDELSERGRIWSEDRGYKALLPFDEPERFHCLMMIVGVEKLFNSLDCTQDQWESTVTQKFANKVKSELKQMNDFE